MDSPRLMHRAHHTGGLQDAGVLRTTVLAVTVRVVGDDERTVGLLGEVLAGGTVVASDVGWAPRDSHILD
jgi:hypothetical protein